MTTSELYRLILELGPDVPRKWTETERLYLQFRGSRDATVKKDCRGRLAAICIKAVGHLTPPWKGKWNPDFLSLRHKARAPWVYRWMDEQLKVPQMDLMRFIGRRCKFALLKEIREATRKHHVKREPATPPTANQEVERRQQLMAAFNKHLKYAFGKAELTAEERVLALDSILKGTPLRNVDLARQWGCSEGKVRKVKASLLKKFKRAKEQRTRHYEEKDSRQRRQSHAARMKAGKRGVKDKVWWDDAPRQNGGFKSLAVNTKIK
jgi:hypothetical protein